MPERSLAMKDQQPAFPIVEPNEPCSVSAGITIRDYFAAKAMESYIITNHNNILADVEGGTLDEIAEDSYKMADAMLKAREA